MSVFDKVCIVTDKNSWFLQYGKELVQQIVDKCEIEALFFTNHRKLPSDTEVVFLLSYFSIVSKKFIKKFKHVLVVHESDLPKGKGWAPFFWQIIEGKNEIPVVLFEASQDIDSGPVWLKDSIKLEGHELHDELRLKQAETTKRLCINFLNNYSKIRPKAQVGQESNYSKRSLEDSNLDPNKTIHEQFDLLRTVNNKEFPAYFEFNGHKYVLRIYKDDQV